MADAAAHTPIDLESPRDWTLYVAHSEEVQRLVVFVHGFNGRTVKTWLDFPTAGNRRDWWRNADLLFVGYRSLRENISGVASRLRRELPRFYPIPFAEAMEIGGVRARDNVAPYSELILLGHSLGGLVLRRAMVDGLTRWREQGHPEPQPAWLTGQMRLFSPANAGFQSAGLLGAIQASGIWGGIEMFLCSSSAYKDLQPGSAMQVETRRRTEMLAADRGGSVLRARIVWANPDEVVITERYDSDFVDDSYDDRTHSTVCKPVEDSFEMPWDFAETGLIP